MLCVLPTTQHGAVIAACLLGLVATGSEAFSPISSCLKLGCCRAEKSATCQAASRRGSPAFDSPPPALSHRHEGASALLLHICIYTSDLTLLSRECRFLLRSGAVPLAWSWYVEIAPVHAKRRRPNLCLCWFTTMPCRIKATALSLTSHQ